MRSSFLLSLATVLIATLVPEAGHAQAKSSIAEVLCTITGWLTGPLGQVIGILGVIALGLAAMFGKLQLGTVFTTMAGIALIFGAPRIVTGLGLDLQLCGKINSKLDILQSPIYEMFSCIILWFLGPMGKSLATMAIIVLGIFATYGKISYHQALVVSSGIATMYGATNIITNLGVGAAAYGACSGGGAGMLESVYCSMVNWFNGPLGKGMATIGIIILGLGALYGKVSWGLAIIAGVGLALIFGGTTIVSALGGPGDQACNAAGTGVDMPLTIMFCNVVYWFNGPIGKGITTLAIVLVGLGALFGKVSWTMALMVGVGVALVFGATTIVSSLGGPDGGCM